MSSQLIRACLLYEFKLANSAAEATRKICLAFGEDAVKERTARNWFQKFRTGDESLEDEPRTGRPLSLDIEALPTAIEDNSSLTCQELSLIFNVSDETIRQHLHKIGKTYKLSKWIPHELSEANKQLRLTNCLSLLSRENSEPFLDRLLTCDEKWVVYKNPTRRRHWLSRTDPVPVTARKEPHEMKVLLCIWWTARGVVHSELLKRGQTITGELYSQQLERVHRAMQTKEPALINGKGVVFLQDNARPHVSKVTQGTIKRLLWETLYHPPYSPDLSPWDYYLFHILDNHLGEKEFGNDEEVQSTLDNFFTSKTKDFYHHGIHQLPTRWAKVIELDGNYFPE